MANYSEKPKKKSKVSRDIAVDKLDFYNEPHTRTKKQDKIKGRPKSGFQKFCYAAFPMPDDEPGEKFRKIILIAAVIVFVATVIVLIMQLVGMEKGHQTNSHIANIGGVNMDDHVSVVPDYDPFAVASRPPLATGETDESTEEIDVTPLVNNPVYPNWADLKATNPDTKAWIKIQGTAINNVVVQGKDNAYYLDKDFFGNDSISGTIFSHYKNKWDGSGENIILFGHNMITGDFFAGVKYYVPNHGSREPLAYYKVHPTIMLATPNGGCEVYKIFGGLLANTQEQYGEVFKYVNKTSFSGRDDFNNFILNVMERSWFFTDVDINYGDTLLTLSTCCWPLGKEVDTRWVLFARKVRPGESETVDVTKAQINPSPHLFKYYYTYYSGGGDWNGVCPWDKSKLLSY